jgi:hypothetical protein
LHAASWVKTGRISVRHVAAAMKKVQAMDLAQRVSLSDEIFIKQPNLLASCLVQPRLGVTMQSVEVLLNILLVCYQAMKESGLDWPVISEDDQERQMQRMVGAVKFSEEIPDPTVEEAARAQYLDNHPEQPLLAFVLAESNTWLRDLARRQTESKSDKFVMMASINLVNCIAYAEPRTKASTCLIDRIL